MSSIFSCIVEGKEPFLRLSPMMHTGMINRIDVDDNGAMLATASDDKTVHLWDLRAGGRLHRILRPFIGTGNEGKLFAVAISPDLSQVATAGWTKGDYRGFGKHSIYLFDTTNAEIVNHLTGLENTVLHLDFSSNGQYLAGALSNNEGIRVWRLSDLTEVMRDMDYAGDSYWVEFSSDGKYLISSSYDGYLRLYSIQNTPQLQHKAKIAELPFTARFSPDNEKIAVGFIGQARIAVVSAKDLTLLYWTTGADNKNGDLFITHWSQNGEFLYGGGEYRENNKLSILRWDKAGKDTIPEVWPVAQNTIMGLHALTRQRLLYASSEPNWGILDARGQHILNYRHETVYFNKNFPGRLLVSKDAQVIQFEHNTLEHATPLRFSLEKQGLFKIITQPPTYLEVSEIQYHLLERKLFNEQIDNVMGMLTQEAIKKFQQITGLPPSGQLDPPTVVALLNEKTEVFPPILTAPNVEIKFWKNSERPQLNGRLLALEENDLSISYALSPNGASLVLGTCFYLYNYDKEGNKLWQRRTPGIVWAVNIAANGKILVAAFSDGTLRWFNLEDGSELLALYPHIDQRRWIAWTPSGIYAASVGADTLIGWHLNNLPEQTADFFPMRSLRERYYQPQTLARILNQNYLSSTVKKTKDTTQSHKNKEEIVSPLLNLPKTFPPQILVLTPRDGQTFSTPEIEIDYELRFYDGISPTDLHLMVDGRPWLTIKSAEQADPLKGHFTVTLPQRTLEISLIAENEHGISTPKLVSLKWEGISSPIRQSTLYVLGIGISDYLDKTLNNLPTARKDAKAFISKWEQQTEHYREIRTRYLADSTYTEIMDSLSWLRKEATSEDVVIIFLAGHALQHKDKLRNSYFFLPSDATPINNTISATILMNVFKNIQSKIILFVDTAHFNILSKRHKTLSFADINGFANELRSPENGIIVFASTIGTQFSQIGETGHGVFTSALLEALDGKADFYQDKQITLSEMGDYISNRVSELTNGQQTPVLAIPETLVNFVISKVTESPPLMEKAN